MRNIKSFSTLTLILLYGCQKQLHNEHDQHGSYRSIAHIILRRGP